jgi:hypothetical protein
MTSFPEMLVVVTRVRNSVKFGSTGVRRHPPHSRIPYTRPALTKALRMVSPRNWLGTADFWL